jgi:7-cyano-7-deazaguanine synthase
MIPKTDYKAIVVLSGGLDSTTMLYRVAKYDFRPGEVLALSFNYGQRHVTELAYASHSCTRLGVDWHLVDMECVQALLPGSALTSDVEVPEGHYADETMKATVVPNRNSIMANVAIGAAVGFGATRLYLGVHAGDHPVYPDCRPEFILELQKLAMVANEGFIAEDFQIECPWLHIEKDHIAAQAYSMGLDFRYTWSCYKGVTNHCGRCSTCVERLEAIAIAGLSHVDNTEYDDTEYWKEAVGWDSE